jgi:hypothetical protein
LLPVRDTRTLVWRGAARSDALVIDTADHRDLPLGN